MPPNAVKTLRDLLYWQYAKLISESAGFGKANYAFMMDRFKRLQVGDLEWSSSIREWLRERESPGSCIYCGSREK
ncbi:MAG: HNH endonuclease, partial [Candidatus Bathyarchaeota archaeon]